MAEKTGREDFKHLLTIGGLPELGPGPRAGVLDQKTLTEKLTGLFSDTNLPPRARELVRGLILLWHDHHDAAHEIAQAIENADGSFLHGIIHRREPDYGNATYWFRRVGRHACFPEIAARTTVLLNARVGHSLTPKLIGNGEWDPFAFIQFCEKAVGKRPDDPLVTLLREIQGIESEVLLEHFLS